MKFKSLWAEVLFVAIAAAAMFVIVWATHAPDITGYIFSYIAFMIATIAVGIWRRRKSNARS